MIRYVAVALALCCAAGVAFGAEVAYTNQTDWEAALAGRPIRSGDFPTTSVPLTGATVVGYGITLTFPANHGGMTTGGDGWRGDVHTFGDPAFNLITFDSPIDAFRGSFDVGTDFPPPGQAIFLRFGDGPSFKLARDDHKPGFFGWMSDTPVSQIMVTGNDNLYYQASSVQFVPAVPEPATVWTVLALIGVVGTTKLRQRRRD